MAIKMNTICLWCQLKKHMTEAERLGDEDTAMAFSQELLEILAKATEKDTSSHISPAINDLYRKYFGMEQDRYVQEKRDSNDFIMEKFDTIAQLVEQADDAVFAGLQFAILGNYLDFSALQGQVSYEKLDEMLEDALKMELDMDTYRQLISDLEKGKNLLYLTDNAGEIAFDRIFAEQLQKKFPHLQITFCVRGYPVHNDATREDAEFVGVPFQVIDSGSDLGGTDITLLGQEARNALEQADVIIAKGMGNTETMYGCGYNVYYAFLVKCQRFVTHFGYPMFTPLLVKERT